MKQMTQAGIVGSVLFASLSAGGQAFVDPDGFGWTRADATATHYFWDDFGSTAGANQPDVAAIPLMVDGVEPSVTETTGTAFLTSTGNLYSFTEPLAFEVRVPVLEIVGGTTRVLLQLATVGTEIDQTTLLIGGVGPTEVQELDRLFLGDGQFGGFLVDALYVFEVPSANPIVITFSAAEPSLSLDAISVDTVSLEPACLADVNGDGMVNGLDFGAWLNAFNANSPSADQNGDGSINGLDFGAWLGNFNAGC